MTNGDRLFGTTLRAVSLASALALACLVPIRPTGGETLLADAATGARLGMVERPGSMIRRVAVKRCLRIRKSGGTSSVVNLCGACVSAKLQHQRPRGDFPIHRDVVVPERGTVQLPLSFRSGRTRILDEKRCGGGAAMEANAEQCVGLQQARDGNRLLVNTCRACRAVVVERVSGQGDRSMRTYIIDAMTYLPYGGGGADHDRVLVERPCR
ncbi:MAG: hypothetical protein QF830_07565 [Rhodospirillales bacterium]|nr:hypothetical protein [Rhodospirillales bacterium]MDP6883977.1 hypothetical protein [Rhodospirillales bacterium]